jgi:large subunit ribosomal protein L9
MTEVILLERIERLGQIGDVVKVRPGYARNYLLPQKKALRASKDNLAVFEARKAQILADNLARKEAAVASSGNVDGLKLVLVRQAGESGQLYGSVSARDVAEAAAAAGQDLVKKTMVVIDRPIKTTGVHQVRVALHPEVSVSVTLAVAQSAEEAKALLAALEPKAAAAAEAPAEEAAEA